MSRNLFEDMVATKRDLINIPRGMTDNGNCDAICVFRVAGVLSVVSLFPRGNAVELNRMLKLVVKVTLFLTIPRRNMAPLYRACNMMIQQTVKDEGFDVIQ